MKKLAIVVFVFLIMSLSAAAAIPRIDSYVTDKAGVLSLSAETQLEEQLRALEKETNGVQYVVYVENEYPKEYSLEEYTLKIAEDNNIGKKGNDNGVLLYVAVKDRKYRWEIGYGAESTLNAALLGRISREYIIPNFIQGDYEKGILQSVDITRRILLGSNDPDILKLKNESGFHITSKQVIVGILLALMALWIIYSIIVSFKLIKTGRKTLGGSYKDHFYTGAAGGLFSGGFGSGGSGSLGGFSGGGFSGGGGGFGGGGSSGGW